MMHIPPTEDMQSRGEPTEISDEAAYFVAVQRVWGPAPDDHEVESWRSARRTDEGLEMLYQRGDELPPEAGRELTAHNPQLIAVLDEGGDFLTGAFGVSVADRERALDDWRAGKRFIPPSAE